MPLGVCGIWTWVARLHGSGLASSSPGLGVGEAWS